MLDELAARADWAIMSAAECNHAPIVDVQDTAITAKAGETVDLTAQSASDPDGDELNIHWWLHEAGSIYGEVDEAADQEELFGMPTGSTSEQSDIEFPQVSDDGLSASFTVPEDAQPGNRFIINMEVQDDAERPMTRFGQFVVTVE